MSLEGKRIALIVDQPQRDLPGLLLTAYDLCCRGATCHFVLLNLQHREIWALRPDFVLLNYFRKYNFGLALGLQEAGIPFGLLDTEGGVWESFESYTDLLWNDRALLACSPIVCMWGRRMADHLCERGYFSRSQTRLTGCPRFDFYHPRWKSVLLEDLNGNQNPIGGSPRRVLLINTSFPEANPRFTTREQSVEYQSREYDWSEAKVHRIVSMQDAAITKFIALTRSLARDYPTLTIVLRPHPHESPAPYENGLANTPNVRINAEGPVQPQIIDSIALIQRGCTTAIEAGMAGVPTFSPQWIPVPFCLDNAERASVSCLSYPELRSHLDRILQGTYRASPDAAVAVDSIVKDWFFESDGLSYRRVADAVEEGLADIRSCDERVCRRLLYGLGAPAMPRLEQLGRWMRYQMRLTPDWSFLSWKKVPGQTWVSTSKHLDVELINRWIRRIHRVLSHAGAGGDDRFIEVRPSREVDAILDNSHVHALTMRAIRPEACPNPATLDARRPSYFSPSGKQLNTATSTMAGSGADRAFSPRDPDHGK